MSCIAWPKCHGTSLSFIVARADTYRTNIAAIVFCLRMNKKVAIDFTC